MAVWTLESYMWHPNPVFSEPYVGLLMFSTDDPEMPRVTVAMKPWALRHILGVCEPLPNNELKIPDHLSLNELLVNGENLEAIGWPEEWDKDLMVNELDRLGLQFKDNNWGPNR